MLSCATPQLTLPAAGDGVFSVQEDGYIKLVDLKNNKFSCLGPTSTRFAITDPADIGRAVAQLSVLALDPATAGTVPDTVRIAGQIVSMEDIRDAAARISGREPGEIVSGDLAAVKESLRKNFPNPPMSIIDYAR